MFASLNKVTAYLAGGEKEARAYMGFKQIDVALRWDMFAKARFIVDWYLKEIDEGITIEYSEPLKICLFQLLQKDATLKVSLSTDIIANLIQPMTKYFDAIVIGGGLNGLSAAWHLSQQSGISIAVLEQFAIGHKRGSSHGMSRIIRSTYSDPDLIRLMSVVLQREWPELENAYGSKLIHQIAGCLFGPDGGLFDNYAEAVAEAGANIEQLTEKQAAQRFPAFNFSGLNTLADNSAGLIDAKQTIQALQRLVESNGVELRENTAVSAIDTTSDPIVLDTATESYHAQFLIIANGAWADRLVPELSGHLQVVRQTVGYFSAADTARITRKQFPVWAYLGENEDDVFYGLPEFGRPGLKAAKHLTETKVHNNPDTLVAPGIENLQSVFELLKQRLNFPIHSIFDYETCLYTLTPSHNFIIDNHPHNPNISIGAGFSGHGFKFGPLTGRLLAELALKQTTTVEIFNAMREKFAMPTNG